MRAKTKRFAISWLALMALSIGLGFYDRWRIKDLVSLFIAISTGVLGAFFLWYEGRYHSRVASMPTERRQ